jgi:hypothetical protein
MNFLPLQIAIDSKTVTDVANGPNGLYFVIGGIVVLFIIALVLIAKNKSFKDLIGHKTESPTIIVQPTAPITAPVEQKLSDQSVQMSIKTFNVLLKTIEDVDDDFIDNREKIKSKYRRIVIAEQDQCIRKVITTFSLEYSSKVTDVDDENLDESTRIIDLYLQTDLNKTLTEEFKKLKEDNDFENYSSEDITSKVSRIVENVVREMRLAIIKGYVIVNKEIFLKLFDTNTQQLKDNVSIVVNKYISSDKSQKEDIDKAMEERRKNLELRLKDLVEVV